MRFEFEKNLRIVSEIITYFHKLGTDDIDLKMQSIDNNSYFIISGKVESLPSQELEYLNCILNTHRQHEVEQYYWHLGGESELDCELSLIGMMVDNVDISYDNKILTLKILRKNS